MTHPLKAYVQIAKPRGPGIGINAPVVKQAMPVVNFRGIIYFHETFRLTENVNCIEAVRHYSAYRDRAIMPKTAGPGWAEVWVRNIMNVQ